MSTEQILEKATEFILMYGPKLVGAILVWIIGNWIIKFLVKGLTKLMTNAKLDASLVPFLRSMSFILLKVLLGISVLGMLGVEMTSFIAILGAAGLGRTGGGETAVSTSSCPGFQIGKYKMNVLPFPGSLSTSI